MIDAASCAKSGDKEGRGAFIGPGILVRQGDGLMTASGGNKSVQTEKGDLPGEAARRLDRGTLDRQPQIERSCRGRLT
jgi:hypothetical protein